MRDRHAERLRSADGIVVPGGFGSRGSEGKIRAVRYARENEVPFLGLCLGFQLAVVEHARNVVGLTDAHSAELESDTPHPVIDLLPEQYDMDDLGGTMRLGAHETTLEPESLAARIYGAERCVERHRHRYEVNPDYIDRLETDGFRFSGHAGNRMEVLERSDHPFFLGTQFHPEFRSRPDRASPPFLAFLDAVMAAGDVEGAGTRDRDHGDDGDWLRGDADEQGDREVRI
jgi:CTP synthase